MNKFISFMKEMETEKLIEEGNYAKAIPYILEAMDKEEYIDRFSILDKLAYCYIKLENYDAGLKYLNEMYQINPHAPSVKHNLGICHFYLENYELAANYFEDVYESDKSDDFIAFHLCLCNIKMNNFEKAEPLFDYFVVKADAALNVFNLGMNLIQEDDPQRSKDLFLKYLQHFPKEINATFGLGVSYIELKDYQKAIECFSRVYEEDKERYPMTLVLLGMCFFEVGQTYQAQEVLKVAIEQDRTNMEAWYYIGIVYEALGQPDDAIEALKYAAGLKPHASEIWERLAYIYLNQKVYAKARESFLKVFQITNNPEYAYRIGLSYMLEEKYDKAIDYFTLCLESSKNTDDIYENLGICYYHLRKYWESIQYLEPLIKKGVSKEIIFFIYGSSLMKVGKLNQAREILEQGLKVNPSEINILYGLGLLEANKEDYHKASQYLEKAIIIDRNPDIIYTLALTKMKLGEADSAIDLFEEYMLHKEPEPDTLYKIGLLYIQLKEFHKAKRIFQDIVSIDPGNQNAKNYIKDLEKL
ncbi:MAG: tetratricopeptide repeat protein [Brevinematales bacterium]|nr:tetratricopeptide repeat protein [Brevinematales bacterium]